MFFVTDKGLVYAFGDGSSGQLGLGTSELESSTPTQLNLRNIKVKYAACGKNFTALITGMRVVLFNLTYLPAEH